LKLLCFRIYSEGYAVETSKVVEVVRRTLITPLPESPLPIKGIFLYRNKAVPLMNEVVLFGASSTSNDSKYNKIIIVKGPEGLFGIEALIEGVIDMKKELINVPEEVQAQKRIFLKGLIKTDQQIYALLNIESFVLENLKKLEGKL